MGKPRQRQQVNVSGTLAIAPLVPPSNLVVLPTTVSC